MIFISRSQPAPECLTTEKLKKAGDYKCGEVLARIHADFKNKCYICEEAEPTTINVEHFVPHNGNPDLKFDWENLHYSCGHCNNTKNQQPAHNNILNCTIADDHVDTHIKYVVDPFPKTKVLVTAINDSIESTNTARLLDAVYNGTTPLKAIESANLRSKLDRELRAFNALLQEYTETPNEDCKTNINNHLNSSVGSFTAFKRWIVWENPVLIDEFGEFCK